MDVVRIGLASLQQVVAKATATALGSRGTINPSQRTRPTNLLSHDWLS
ncbi:MAG: hypothetical protein ACKO7Z_03820 [Cyanobacteriota bacterium]